MTGAERREAITAGIVERTGITEEMNERLVRGFYAKVRGDALLAPIFTAGAITQEKDSQTYDILLATPLTNGQIVLGSLLSRLFFIVALLVSGIPIFSITQIFGGVAIKSIALSFGILIDAFVVRMTLIPAVMAIAGERAWWLPRWLDWLLPNVDIEGEKLRRQFEPQPLEPEPELVSNRA